MKKTTNSVGRAGLSALILSGCFALALSACTEGAEGDESSRGGAGGEGRQDQGSSGGEPQRSDSENGGAGSEEDSGSGGAKNEEEEGPSATKCVEHQSSLAYWWSQDAPLPEPGSPPPLTYLAVWEEMRGAHADVMGVQFLQRTSGPVRTSAKLDGSLYLSYGAREGYLPTDTVEFWVQTKDLTGTVVSLSDRYEFRLEGGFLVLRFSDRSDPDKEPLTLKSSKKIADGKPHHIAAVLTPMESEERASVRLSLDGRLDGSLNLVENLRFELSMLSSVAFGGPGEFKGTAANTKHLTGFVDELSLYSEALSKEQIFEIYDAGSKGKCLPDGREYPW